MRGKIDKVLISFSSLRPSPAEEGIYSSHALRGNSAFDAPRHLKHKTQERRAMHSHAERGNDKNKMKES